MESDPQNEAAAPSDAATAAEPAPEAPAGVRAKRPSRAQMRLRNRRRRFAKRKVSRLTHESTDDLDYKDVKTLRSFLTPEGKILPRRITGNSAKQQRALATAIKRARHIALIPFRSVET